MPHEILSLQKTSLQLAVEWGEKSIIEALLDAGADVNAVGEGSVCYAPLTIAVNRQEYELAEFLIEAGAEINNPKTRITGRTALCAAVTVADLDMAVKILDHGADSQDPAALRATAELADRTLLDIILKSHSKRYPKRCKGFGSDVLKIAVDKGDVDLTRMMLRRKADCNAFVRYKNNLDVTPFGYAIFKDNNNTNSFVELFLQEGSCKPDAIVSRTQKNATILDNFPQLQHY